MFRNVRRNRCLEDHIKSFQRPKAAKSPVKPLEKIIPKQVLGIQVADETQVADGMQGTLDWLKNVRIHKYWPFFSHLEYEEMISLRDENLESYLAFLGASEKFHVGARRKILRSIDELRDRVETLEAIEPSHVEESCEAIKEILKTPICDYKREEDGTYLTGLLMKSVTRVVDHVRENGNPLEPVKSMLEEFIIHPLVLEYDKVSARVWLQYIKLGIFYKPKFLLNTCIVYDKISRKADEKCQKTYAAACDENNNVLTLE